MRLRELGRTGIRVSPIGLGCMQLSRVGGGATQRGFAAAMFEAQSQSHADQIVQAALDGGISWFDTAEMYGHGASERALSRALTTAGVKPGDVTVATKWAPFGRWASSIERTIDDRLAALDPYPVDLFQIHFPVGSLSTLRAQISSMARLVAAGTIRSVGVSNFPVRAMKRAHQLLAEHGVPLASNQVQINLLHRRLETNGLLETAQRLGITLIAYSPLREGILTGRFHEDRSRLDAIPRLRRVVMRITPANLDRTESLISALRQVAEAHHASVSQVALAWLVQNYGETVLAIPGASKPYQAHEAAKAQTIELSADELDRLSRR